MKDAISQFSSDGAPGKALRDELHRQLSDSGDFLIAGLGDSLTYGWMVRRGFFDLFMDAVSENFPQSSLQRFNAGIPGDTAAGGLGRLDALLERGPNAVTIQFGLNDMAQGVDPGDFEASLIAIVLRIRGASAIPIVVTSSPLPWPEGERSAELFYGICRTVAKTENVPIASLDRYWQDRFATPSEWIDILQSDRVHPTGEGHALMAEGLFEALFPIRPM